MKKLALLVFGVMMAWQAASAQEKPFEGEIVYETFEHYSDAIKKQFNSAYFDGVHKIRLIIKGRKMHMIDETTKIHCVVDDALQLYTEFCEWNQKGFCRDKNTIDAQAILAQRDLTLSVVAAGSTFCSNLLSYTFSQKNEEKTFLGIPCKLYEGDICRNVGNNQTYSIKTYVSDILSPAGYKWSLYGLEIPGIALKWRMKMDIGHVNSLGVLALNLVKGGEHSMYIEADVLEITPRNVSDEEFSIPSNYDIVSANNGFATLKYQKDVKKQLKKHGIKGGNKEDKTTGVHYQTDEEWDF